MKMNRVEICRLKSYRFFSEVVNSLYLRETDAKEMLDKVDDKWSSGIDKDNNISKPGQKHSCGYTASPCLT